MASDDSKQTTDHETIREWVEERGGEPATVESTADDGDAGVLRIQFPDVGDDENLRSIEWDEFFETFEENDLAFLYQEETSDGEESRFFKFVSRE